MIEYYSGLTEEEQDAVTEVVQTLLRQTFLLEKKYDKRSGRMTSLQIYRTAEKHFDFLKAYFAVAGIELHRSMQTGMIYITQEALWGEKLPRLATIYLLILKLLYDEQMASASSSSHVVITVGMLNGKAGEFHVLNSLPSPTELRRTIALLKRYQIVDPLDVLEELDEDTRLIIYPCINAVLTGEEIRALLATFSEEDYVGNETAVQGVIEDMPE